MTLRAEGATCRTANLAPAAARTLVPMRFTAAVTHEGSWQVARCLEVAVEPGRERRGSARQPSGGVELDFEDEMLPESIERPIISTIELSA